MQKKLKVLFRSVSCLFLAVFLLTGCAALDTKPAALTGVFIDAPVSGITFKTPTQGGITNAAGEFKYLAGETVAFSIGELALGSAVGKPILSPLDIIADAKDTSDQRVINICVLLQTLDQDGNPANGISISQKVVSFVNNHGKKIEFNKHPRAFSFDVGLRSLLTALNDVDAFGELPRAVMSPTVAKKNFEAELAKLKIEPSKVKKEAEPAKK